ncbi:MAG: methyltransferase domain-containing protein [Myxococcales bacterium]|nr:methyltransferase domain-containing protein [Myxococcales bacterium]
MTDDAEHGSPVSGNRDVIWPERFPRSAKYDARWMRDAAMGPNPLWLTEWLYEAMDLRPGMRVLDLGCGRAASSIFLAKEFGVRVWATDLWIGADENWTRICEAGLQHEVTPIHANARSLPYAKGFFDAIIAIDSYIYFGTDDLYLAYLAPFVAPGGQIGVVMPGFAQDIGDHLPEHLRPFWGQDCWSWHPAHWWRHHWARTGLVDVERSDNLPEAGELWQRTEEGGDEAHVVAADKGRYMGMIRLVGRTRPADPDAREISR